MRGALGQQLQVGLNVRIIPADAGSTPFVLFRRQTE